MSSPNSSGLNSHSFVNIDLDHSQADINNLSPNNNINKNNDSNNEEQEKHFENINTNEKNIVHLLKTKIKDSHLIDSTTATKFSTNKTQYFEHEHEEHVPTEVNQELERLAKQLIDDYHKYYRLNPSTQVKTIELAILLIIYFYCLLVDYTK